jgi:hypothetical protein
MRPSSCGFSVGTVKPWLGRTAPSGATKGSVAHAKTRPGRHPAYALEKLLVPQATIVGGGGGLGLLVEHAPTIRNKGNMRPSRLVTPSVSPSLRRGSSVSSQPRRVPDTARIGGGLEAGRIHPTTPQVR